MHDIIIEAHGLKRYYRRGSETVKALDGVDLTIRTGEVLRMVGLSERAGHLPRELSGGQMQRVAIARALLVDPKILVADEPTGNLDKATGESIIKLFRRLAEENGLAILLTTHNPA